MKKEEEILKKLADCWNEFTELKQQHPSERDDFLNGIHKCQYVLSMRFARDSRPDLFPEKEINNEDVPKEQINKDKKVINQNDKDINNPFNYLSFYFIKNTAILLSCEREKIPNTIKEIEIPKYYGYYKITTIGSSAFFDCINISSVKIPNTITYINPHAFNNCISLKSIEIPKTVIKIGEKALGYDEYYRPIMDFTIYGYCGTEAERYANENHFYFICLD